MKRNISVRPVLCVLWALAVSSVWAFQLGGVPQPFSADMTITPKTGEKVTGKIYFSPPKNRMDMNTRQGSVSTITDGSTKTSYTIMHAQKMYMEMHLDQLANQMGPMMKAPKAPSSFDPSHPCGADMTCKKVGTETVNGRVCDKWVMSDKRGNTTTAWIDQKLFYPIKTQSSGGDTFDLTNVKEGPQPAALFQPPADYRKMDLGNMMGGGRPK